MSRSHPDTISTRFGSDWLGKGFRVAPGSRQPDGRPELRIRTEQLADVSGASRWSVGSAVPNQKGSRLMFTHHSIRARGDGAG